MESLLADQPSGSISYPYGGPRVPTKQLIYIAGSGHSGSTLLDMLLGRHSQISSLGEAHFLSMNAGKSTRPRLCSCGKAINECPFWTRVEQELEAMLNIKGSNVFERFPTTHPANLQLEDNGDYLQESVTRPRYGPSVNTAALIVGSKSLWSLLGHLFTDVELDRTIIHNSLMVYEAVRRAWGTPVIIDSTKNPTRLKGLYLAVQEPFRILYLIRDGRAVSYSRMQRQRLPMEQCARIWRAEQTKQWLARLSIPKSLITYVCYEDLCRCPEQELMRICNVIGVDYQPAMLEFRNDVHNLGGNAMRFRANERDIRLDEKWRREMKAEDLRTFERVAGNLNKVLGYVE